MMMKCVCIQSYSSDNGMCLFNNGEVYEYMILNEQGCEYDIWLVKRDPDTLAYTFYENIPTDRVINFNPRLIKDYFIDIVEYRNSKIEKVLENDI